MDSLLFGSLVPETPQQRMRRLMMGMPANSSAPPPNAGMTPWAPPFGQPGGSLPFDRYAHKVKSDAPELPPFNIPGMSMPGVQASAPPSAPASPPPSFPPFAGLINDRSLPPFEPPGSSGQYMPPMRLPRDEMPTHAHPFTGLRNTPHARLPPFVPPGSSLPMERYMMGPPSAPPMTPAAAVMASAPPMQQPQDPSQQPGAMPGPQAGPALSPEQLAEAKRLAELGAWRMRAAPWTINEGNYADQYGA